MRFVAFKSAALLSFFVEVFVINWKSNVISKKRWKWANDARRRLITGSIAAERRSLVLNSIPKSGTHLLYQVLAPLGLKDFGGFLATTPSVSLKKRPPSEHVDYLDRLFHRELLSAHMHFDEQVAEAVERLEQPLITIIRDPRDIFISELDYLSEVNRWHRMHRFYKRARDDEAAFTLCLEGMPDASFCYPSFAERIEPYLGWLHRASTLTVRFEQLRNTATQQKEMLIIARYLERGGLWSDGESSFVQQAQACIDPSASHTFRQGGVGTWRERLSDDQADRLEQVIAPIARFMGYP